MFLAEFLSYSVLFYLQKFNLTFSQKNVFVRDVIFLFSSLKLSILGNEEILRLFTWVFIDQMILELVYFNS